MNNMTQLELAEKLNYSNKTVSKWERAESSPDIAVLVEIADLFGVSLDYLVREENADMSPSENARDEEKYNRRVIAYLSESVVWFVSVSAFILTTLITGKATFQWLLFSTRFGSIPDGTILSFRLLCGPFLRRFTYLFCISARISRLFTFWALSARRLSSSGRLSKNRKPDFSNSKHKTPSVQKSLCERAFLLFYQTWNLRKCGLRVGFQTVETGSTLPIPEKVDSRSAKEYNPRKKEAI